MRSMPLQPIGTATFCVALSLVMGCRGSVPPGPGVGGQTDRARPTPSAAQGDARAEASGTAASGGTRAPAPTLDPTLEAVYAGFRPPVRGDDQAPVMLYVFSDYLCPQCKGFAEDTEPLVDAGYVSSGKVAVVFLDFPVPGHGYPAMVAHEAAHCAAEQGRYWDMHDALFVAQAELAALDVQDEEGAKALAGQIGGRIGLDAAELARCIADERYRPVVASLYQKARENGITTAPTLLLQSEVGTDVIEGNPPIAELRPRIDAALARAASSPHPTPATPATPATP